MTRILAAVMLVLAPMLQALALSIEDFSQSQMVNGLKQALDQGAANAVLRLGKENGYFNYDKVKIPLPPALKKAEKVLRTVGMRKQADDLVLGMNRAAEQAAPEAKALLLDAVKKMSVDDAKNILTGGNDSVTQYFRKTTEAKLTERFLPIVTGVTDRIGLAQQYNKLAGTASKLGMVETKDAKIESYVTRKALDGLYLVMAEEERNIRQNPVKAATDLVRGIFGALKK